MLLHSDHPVVTRTTEILGGVLVFAGTRVPFQTLIDYLKSGDTLDEFLDNFPTVSRDMALIGLESAQAALTRQISESVAG